jgi:hypothetical protein
MSRGKMEKIIEKTGVYKRIVKHGPERTTRILLETEGRLISGLIYNGERDSLGLDRSDMIGKQVTVKMLERDMHDPAPEHHVSDNPNTAKIDPALFVGVNNLSTDENTFTDGTDASTETSTEGKRKITCHITYERNKKIIDKIKKSREWVCDICNVKPETLYDISFIEAHHKVMVSESGEEHDIKESDLVLLCPNCHTAVHCLMRHDKEYEEIKNILKRKLKGAV